MRKFKHKILGEVLEKLNNSDTYHTIGGPAIHKRFIENSNDWEEIVEKDYEILSFLSINGIIINKTNKDYFGLINGGVSENYLLTNNLYKIHSIKRLSDGEIFTINDKINGGCGNYNITKIKIQGKIVWLYYFSTQEYTYNLKEAKHSKKPLFITEDGVEIFENDIYFQVNNKTFDIKTFKADQQYTYGSCNHLRFSSEETAKDYIIMNKSSISLQDICNLNLTDAWILHKIRRLVEVKLNL